MMNLIEAIKTRKSCREFDESFLNPEHIAELEKFISENKTGLGSEQVDFRIVEKKETDKKLKLNYGMIRGNNTYVLGSIKPTLSSRVNYGYLLEKIVLKATKIGISSCWIGYFDRNYFKEQIPEPGYEIPSLVIVGYAEKKQSVGDKLVRYSIKADKRQKWDKLFFNYQSKLPLTKNQIKDYAESLEMLRLAPSSGNTQPWRIFYDDKTNQFHFFKNPINKRYEEMGLHDIDMGIALAHFELTSFNNGLSGNWIQHKSDSIHQMDDMHYIISWKCE